MCGCWLTPSLTEGLRGELFFVALMWLWEACCNQVAVLVDMVLYPWVAHVLCVQDVGSASRNCDGSCLCVCNVPYPHASLAQVLGRFLGLGRQRWFTSQDMLGRQVARLAPCTVLAGPVRVAS